MPDPAAHLRPARMDAVLARVAAGEPLDAICADPAMPCQKTIFNWKRHRPWFASRLASVQAEIRRDPLAFDAELAQRFLDRIRAGAPIHTVLGKPGMPGRRLYRAWMSCNCGFAELVHPVKQARVRERILRRRRDPRTFDQDLADRIYLRVLRGAPLPGVLSALKVARRTEFRRWRLENPEFDRMMRHAMTVGHQLRGRARCACTPELTERIVMAIERGATLHRLSKRADMPSLYALYKWKRERPEFRAAIEQARRDSRFWITEEILDNNPWTAPDAVEAARRRSRVRNLERRAARLAALPPPTRNAR